MFVTGIIRLFRSNQKHAFPTPLGKDDSRHLLFLVLHPCFHHQNFRFLYARSHALLQPIYLSLHFVESETWLRMINLAMCHLFYSIRNPKLETTVANKSSIKPLPSCTRTRFFVLYKTLGLARSSKVSLYDCNIVRLFSSGMEMCPMSILYKTWTSA